MDTIHVKPNILKPIQNILDNKPPAMFASIEDWHLTCALMTEHFQFQDGRLNLIIEGRVDEEEENVVIVFSDWIYDLYEQLVKCHHYTKAPYVLMEIMDAIITTWVQEAVLDKDAAEVFKGLLMSHFHSNIETQLQ